MGLFSGIKKAFKKIVKGVKKVVKGVVKGVKKVVKKIGSSKILKALAIAAAVVVTGGAAIGAFGGSLATSSFGSWMVGASNAITGFTVGGINIGAVMKPFASIGKTVGSVAGGITDFTGLTSEASRAGYTQIQPLGGGAIEPSNVGEWVADPSKTFKPGQSLFPGGKEFETAGRTLSDVKTGTDTLFGTGEKIVDAAGNVSKVPVIDPKTGEAVVSRWDKVKNIATTAAISSGTQMAFGVAQAKLMEGDPTGTLTPLANESKEYQDALQVYAANEGINYGDIYRQLSFGTADPSYQVNSALYSQQAFQPVYTTA